MKKLINLVALIALMASSIALAKPLSAIIDFGGGEIPPTGAFTIPLSKLVNGITYNLTCKIKNQSNEEIIMGVIPFLPSEYLNNEPVEAQNIRIPVGDNNLLVIKSISSGSSFDGNLLLSNADQSLSLFVENCSANAS